MLQVYSGAFHMCTVNLDQTLVFARCTQRTDAEHVASLVRVDEKAFFPVDPFHQIRKPFSSDNLDHRIGLTILCILYR